MKKYCHENLFRFNTSVDWFGVWNRECVDCEGKRRTRNGREREKGRDVMKKKRQPFL